MQCEVINIITPDKVILEGLWFGPKKPKRVVIYHHGLAGNAFGRHEIFVPLVDDKTAVIFYSNRGHDKVTRVKRVNKKSKKGFDRIICGEAHEIFIDCVDDIAGAINFAKKSGAKEILLAGHSTGCQKVAYYLSKKSNQKDILGAILLSPMSDYAAALKFDKKYLTKATAFAKKLVKEKKQHQILPLDIWPFNHDAQRFLSLYTPDSEEEIFSYCQPDKKPAVYQSLKLPLLVVLPEQDEFRDRPMKRIAKWFSDNSNSDDLTICLVPKANHGFSKKEKVVIGIINDWMKEIN